MSTKKVNLKSLTKTEFANHLKQLKIARKKKGVVNRPKHSYLNIKGTRGQIKPTSYTAENRAQPSSANKSNSKMNVNMQMYRNYIQRIVNTGFLDPK